MTNSPFTQFSIKVSAAIIAFIIISMLTAGAFAFRNKLDKKEFEAHCREMDNRFGFVQVQILRTEQKYIKQLEINTELLKAVNRLEIKLERVETNTDWLIKDKQNE